MKLQKVTLFIHGTLPPAAAMKIPLVHMFFFCPRGLTKANELDKKFHLALLADQLCTGNPGEFSREHFYFFGWTGKLRFEARKEAARELLTYLDLLENTYRHQGIKPFFRIITHSHGGNVALYLKEAAEEHTALQIDELVLIACPVQKETAHYVHDPLFKRVFSIHSHVDILQVLDPQGIHNFLESLKQYGLEFTLSHLKQLGPIFSSRHFKSAQNLTQLNVKYTYRELLHLEFLLPAFISELPTLLRLMQNSPSKGEEELTHIL